MIEAKQARGQTDQTLEDRVRVSRERVDGLRSTTIQQSRAWYTALAERIDLVSKGGGDFVVTTLPPRALEVTNEDLERIVFDQIRDLGYTVTVNAQYNEVKVSW